MPFKIFRFAVTLATLLACAWLVNEGVTQVREVSAELSATPGAMVPGAMRIVGSMLLLGLVYFALWADSRIKEVLQNIFSIPELIGKITFTVSLLCIYRIGFHVPLPGVDVGQIEELMVNLEQGAFGQAVQLFSMFTGGSLSRSTLFGLGIMPYISASIIFQLLMTVIPALERLQKEGPVGQKKIQEYIRYATVGLCLVQSMFMVQWMRGQSLLYPEYQNSIVVMLMGMAGLTAGTIFLMWLGEQIDEYGIGNGISLLIMAGIVSRLPNALGQLGGLIDFSLTGASSGIGPIKILFLVGAFVFVVAGAILITQAQRRIPIQQAKQMRGRRVYGGQRHYMPLRVNHGGVMPIIFASSLMIFPNVITSWASNAWKDSEVLARLSDAFQMGSYTYTVFYIGMIYFFAYFWTTVQFRPGEMANQLRDYGSFIPGLRPGKRTAEYLERVMERITYCGAAFLALVAVIPMTISSMMGIPFGISGYLGGTGLLITVSVTLDLVQRIEANLVMRNYGGFLGGSTRIKGAR